MTDLYTEAYGHRRDPAVVFLHGGPGANCYAFQMSMAERLARNDYYVVVYDQRGCGRSKQAPKDTTQFNFEKATEDLREVIEHHGLESPILVGHSWGGFLSLKYLERYPDGAKGLVMVCSPVDYPQCFFNILTRVHKIYDDARSLLRMEHFPRIREIDKLKAKMFACCDGSRPHSDNERRPHRFEFEKADVTAVFVHARMLDFASPVILVLNSGYRKLMEELSSRDDSDLLLRFDEEVGGHYFDNECAEPNTTCMLEKNNIGLVEKFGSKIHAIYSEDDKMFSKGQVRTIQTTLSSVSPNRFSYIYGAGHYPFLEQNRQFLEVLSKHLERIRKQA